jgi:hypothetical protein
MIKILCEINNIVKCYLLVFLFGSDEYNYKMDIKKKLLNILDDQFEPNHWD